MVIFGREPEQAGGVELQINGKVVRVDADPAMPLLWLPRDVLELTGARSGCGACTVRVWPGHSVLCRAVLGPAGVEIQAIEGLGDARKPGGRVERLSRRALVLRVLSVACDAGVDELLRVREGWQGQSLGADPGVG